jgi:predicted GNAT family acetyltransferase
MAAEVRDNPALSRFELDVNGVTAVANYQLKGGVMTITHTEVPPQARHGGIASQLIAGALQVARARGLKIVPRCSRS